MFDSFTQEGDLKAVRRAFPQLRFLSPLLAGWQTTITYGGRSVENEAMTWGINSEFQRISRRGLIAGKPLLPAHVEQHLPVCLIGTELVDRLFRPKSMTQGDVRQLALLDAAPANPFYESEVLGKIIFLSRKDGAAYPCRVRGVLGKQSSNMDWRKPNFDVVMPYTYFQSVASDWEQRFDSFVAQVRAGEDVERVGNGVRLILSNAIRAPGSSFWTRTRYLSPR